MWGNGRLEERGPPDHKLESQCVVVKYPEALNVSRACEPTRLCYFPLG